MRWCWVNRGVIKAKLDGTIVMEIPKTAFPKSNPRKD